MSTIAVVQSRYGSSRLPGKAVRVLAGRPMLAHVLARALAIPGIERVVLATTVADRDTPLTWIADQLGIDVVRGSEADVLSRFKTVVERWQPDRVMRITGDCPLLAPDVCAAVLDYAATTRADYVSNDTTRSGYPDGFDCEIMTARAIELAAEAANVHLDREHVTPWIKRNRPTATLFATAPILPDVKLSVDTFDDFERVRRIYGHLDGDDRGLGVELSLAATLAAYRRAFLQEGTITR